jgi:hypothetical protein
MSSVPYIFADATGNINLSELDANFSNVKAYADSAGVVTASAQPAIRSVGTLGDLVVTGNLTAGYISTANLTTTNNVNFVGNVTGGNVLTQGILSATGNAFTGSLSVSGSLSVIGNVASGNLTTAGTVKNTGLEVVGPNYINITANAQTGNLSTLTSTNFLVANNTGYTYTVNMPASPVDGQITRFTVAGNTVTLVAGTGTLNASFAGTTGVGVGYKYIYRTSDTKWYKSN